MAKSYDSQPEQSKYPPDSGLPGGYPPPSSQSYDGLPLQSGSYSQNRGMDRFLGKLLTFLAIIAVFVLIVVSLKNISPGTGSEIDITPGNQSLPGQAPIESEPEIVGEE